MNFKIEKFRETPLMFVYKDDYEAAKNRGTIIFYHGLGETKEIHVKEHEYLAEKGYLVIAIDNFGHGERKHHDLKEKLKCRHSFVSYFIRLVKDTAIENQTLLDELISHNKVNKDKLGICGISMGGFITYQILQTEKRYKSACAIVASPFWTPRHKEAPYYNIESLLHTPLLSQCATKDHKVNPKFTRNMHNKIEKIRPKGYKHALVEFFDSDHIMLDSDWKIVCQNLANWFDYFI